MGKTKIIKIDSVKPDLNKIAEAAAILREGGLVAFPTETVYGLAALITQKEAVKKLRQIKERPDGKHFSLCIHELC